MRSFFSALPLFLLSGVVAHGALLVYEGMNYPLSSSLDGRSGGTGFVGTWSTSLLPPSLSTTSVSSPSMGYTDAFLNNLDATGNFTAFFGAETVSRNLATTYDTNVVWASFLMKYSSDFFPTDLGVAFVNSNNPTNATEIRFEVGSFSNTVYMDQQGTIGGNTLLNSTAQSDLTSLYIIKFDFTGNELSAWYDPSDLGNLGPANASLTGALASNMRFDRIDLFSNGSGGLYIDELRIGDTAADVTPFTPIPEPSTYFMIGAGGLAVGLFLYRRRKAAA